MVKTDRDREEPASAVAPSERISKVGEHLVYQRKGVIPISERCAFHSLQPCADNKGSEDYRAATLLPMMQDLPRSQGSRGGFGNLMPKPDQPGQFPS